MEKQCLSIPVVWPNYFEDCEPCTQRLKDALIGLDGVEDVAINSDHRTVELSYDGDLVTFEEIREHARLVGVTVADRYRHELVRITGLDCPDCALKLETSVRRSVGIIWASLNYATSVLIVEFEPQRTDLESIHKRVRGFGYDVEELEGLQTGAVRSPRSARLALTLTAGLLLGAGGLSILLDWQSLAGVLFLASAACGGVFAARSGILSLRGLTLDTNFLMSAAAIGAIALGDYWEAAAVMFLFSLGSTLEAHTVDKTRRSIKSLIQAFPTHALVKRHGHVDEVQIKDIEIGEIVIIKPGDKIPVDGTVVDGESAVDQAPITGEHMPVTKAKGDMVYAGSINGKGSVEVRTSASMEDNTLARIIHMVEEAQAQKAPSQRFAEKFGRYYTPCVIALAAAVGAFGPFVFGGTYRDSLERALTLLVVSCPCALVISTPVAIVAAIGNAARSGILIKGGAHLEALGEVSIAAFDKTGTLTMGRLEVAEIVPFNGHTPEEVISMAAAVENRSEHPLADAILRKARDMGVSIPHVSFFEAMPGKGARAVADGGAFYVGSRRLLDELSIEAPGTTAIARLLTQGHTVVYVTDENAIWGAIGATDVVRENSAAALSQLKAAGIEKTIMLTGDTAQTGRVVAAQVGIDEEYSELLPEDKARKIREFASSLGAVAMVGDGINDAPALAAANVGVAMGGAGSHAAIEAADIALMADDIAMLPYAVALSRRARRIIRQNVFFALSVVIALVVGALTKHVNLAGGVFAHEGSALLVIANSMRLLKRQS